MSYTEKLYDKAVLQEGLESFRAQFPESIDWAVVLGSGLGQVLEDPAFEILRRVPFTDIKHLHHPSVHGHAGEAVLTRYANKYVLFLLGRIHLYEGFSAFEVATTVGILGEAGVPHIILSNAAGNLHSDWSDGDLMCIHDHINLQACCCLSAVPDASRFLDMGNCYQSQHIPALQSQFAVQSGVYAGVLGTHYESPAEIRYYRTIGADASGMSTVQEAMMGHFYGMKVYGFTLLCPASIPDANGQPKVVTHEMVEECCARGAKKLQEVAKHLFDKS